MAFSEAYRMKLRNRLKSAKLKTQQKTSLEEVLRTQENQLKIDIESRLISHSEFKKNIGQQLETEFKEDLISREESLKFFFRSDSKDQIEIKTDLSTETSIERNGEEIIQIEDQESRDSRLLIKDMFSSTTNWNLFERNKSEFKSLKNTIKEENKFLYLPSNKRPEETDETLLKEESNNLNKINEMISTKNLIKLKNRLIAEQLKEEFLDQNLLFIDKNNIEINNSINFDPEFGSDKDLVIKYKPSVGSFREVFNHLVKKSDDFLSDGKSDSNERKNERRILANLESIEVDQLNQLLEQLKIQGNAQNYTLISAIERKLSNESPSKSNELEFCTDEDIENNRKFRLLRLRWEGVTNFKNYRFVPINEKEIPSDIFEDKPKLTNSLSTKRLFEEKREKAIETLTKIGEQLIKQSSGTVDRPRTLEDMVIEEDVTGFRFVCF